VNGRVCQGPDCANFLRLDARSHAKYCSTACSALARYRAKRAAEGCPVGPRMNTLPCNVAGCTELASSKYLCVRHYNNQRVYGTPLSKPERSLDDRLRETGWVVTDTGCWEWKGHRNDQGYGLFTAKKYGYFAARAHRVVFEHMRGEEIPQDLVLRHRCDNPPCVNPAHLIPGTKADNTADMMERGRHFKHGRTMCDKGLHDLTIPGARREYSDGYRCVVCRLTKRREIDARYRARKRQGTNPNSRS
jgi:hypothetical protein